MRHSGRGRKRFAAATDVCSPIVRNNDETELDRHRERVAPASRSQAEVGAAQPHAHSDRPSKTPSSAGANDRRIGLAIN